MTHLPNVAISNDCFVYLIGRQGPEIFNKYKDYLKTNLRARYDSERSAWRIEPWQVSEAAKHFEALGFAVTLPRGPLSPLSAKPQVKLRYAEGKMRFKCAERSEAFNEVFNNKSGMLTGITEYLPDSFERATTSFYLAEEATTVLEREGFQVIKDQTYVDTYAFWQAREEGFKTMDPAVAECLAPGFSLFQHQNKAIARIEKANGVFLLGAALGSGKTLIALAYAAKHRLRVCVVGPKVVRRNWIREAQRFFPSFFRVGLELDKRKGATDLSHADIVSVNYEGLGKWSNDIIAGKFDLLIVDESHMCKNAQSARTQFVTELAFYFRFKILLSGTAVKNNRDELNPQLTILDSKRFSEDCGLFSAPTGQFWHSIQSVYMAMPKNEVLPFLPKKTVVRHDQSVANPIDLPASIEEIMLFKHNCAKSKLDITCEKIKDILENSDDAILVFSEFVDICVEIHRRFAKDSLYHDGQMSNGRREHVKELFQREGGPRIFVSTRPSLAVGATLTRASHVLFNDLPWTPADIDQAADRTHRLGQVKPVWVYWIIADNSAFDVRLIDLISQKYTIQKAVTEGKQVSKEELEFLSAPISFRQLLKGAK